MNLLFGQSEYVAAYVSAGLGITISGHYTAIGVLSTEGRLVGGIVFHGFNGSTIEMTAYCPNTMKRGVIRGIAHYVFVQLGCNRMYARTRRSNKAMCKMFPKIGFSFKCVLEQHFGPKKSDDAVLYSISKDVALKRWLSEPPKSSRSPSLG